MNIMYKKIQDTAFWLKARMSTNPKMLIVRILRKGRLLFDKNHTFLIYPKGQTFCPFFVPRLSPSLSPESILS